MKIGVHTKELQNARIDGTMVYLSNVLSAMREMIGDDEMYLYHTRPYNAQLQHVQHHAQYHDRIVPEMPLWTQTGFAAALWRDRCDVLWMPLHNVPLVRRTHMRTVVTIHDLAFHFYPQTYPVKDQKKLLMLTDYAVRRADEIIAISASTKKDLLTVYPFLCEEKIHVVHHGFDPYVWQNNHLTNEQEQKILDHYTVQSGEYIIHVGALQPRKNIRMLIDAFAVVKERLPHYKLVLVGGDGWLAQSIHQQQQESVNCDDIIIAGNVAFDEVRTLMAHARACTVPSLYEGFCLPGLEAMAVGVPVVASDNSCLREIFGAGARYCASTDHTEYAQTVLDVCMNESERVHLMQSAAQNIMRFSWHDTAQRTLAILRG